MILAVLQASVLQTNGALSVAAGAQVTVRTPAGALATLYTDRAGTTPAGNPVTADSSGFFRVYVAPGRYDVTVTTSSGAQVYKDSALFADGFAPEYFGLEYEPSVLPTISSDFERNKHELYGQYGNEPKTILQTWTTTRATTGTYRDAAGVIRTAGIDEPRVDYDPVTGRGALLVEGARTNLLLNSDTLSTQNVSVAGVAHTLHFTGTGTVTLSGAATGELVGAGDGEINRVSLTFTPSAGTLTLTVSGSVKFSQLEAASTPSSYIKTEASQATRSADNVSRVLGSEFTADGFTVFGEFIFKRLDVSNRTLAIGTGSTNRIELLNDGLVTRVAGGTVRVIGFPSMNAGTKYKLAYSATRTAVTLSINGALIGSVAVDDALLTATRLWLSGNASGAGEPTISYSSAKYIPRALSNAELQEITKP